MATFDPYLENHLYMKHIITGLILIVGWVVPVEGWGEVVKLDGNNINFSKELTPSEVLVFQDSTGDMSLYEVARLPVTSFRPYHPDADFFGSNNRNRFWFLIQIENTSSSDTLKAFLHFGRVDLLNIGLRTDAQFQQALAGQAVAFNERLFPERRYFPFQVAPGSRVDMILHPTFLWAATKIEEFTLLGLEKVAHRSWKQQHGREASRIFDGLFYGSLLIMLMFSIIQYFFYADKAYLYYACYILSLLLYYLLKKAPYTPTLFSNYIDLLVPYGSSMYYFIYFSYGVFVIQFLNIRRREHPLLMYVAWVGGALCLAFFCWDVWWHADVSDMLARGGNRAPRNDLLLIGIFIYGYILIRMKIDWLVKWVLIGSLLLIVFAIVSILAYEVEFQILRGNTDFPDFIKAFTFMPFSFAQLGVLLEVIFFSLGLGYRTHYSIRQAEQNSRKAERQLVESKLEVAQKEKEAARFQQHIAEAELKALKAQMNPHFVANTLNSIKNLVQTNKKEEATHYLAVFAQLVRTILDNTTQPVISMSKELDFCQLYLQLESLRFNNDFTFDIKINPDVDTSFVKIPPLVLQPFLENAIWHGLSPKPGIKKLRISLSIQDGNTVCCLIRDNGIGRKAADGNKRNGRRPSYGVHLTRERIQIINQYLDTDIALDIIDQYDNSGQATGTDVLLTIPI